MASICLGLNKLIHSEIKNPYGLLSKFLNVLKLRHMASLSHSKLSKLCNPTFELTHNTNLSDVKIRCLDYCTILYRDEYATLPSLPIVFLL